MMEHFYEGVGNWGRSSMIEIGVPEDVVDMYIEKIRRELKDPRYQLSLTVYVPSQKKHS